VGICVSQCTYDSDCAADSLCCSNGCGTICVPKDKDYTDVLPTEYDDNYPKKEKKPKRPKYQPEPSYPVEEYPAPEQPTPEYPYQPEEGTTEEPYPAPVPEEYPEPTQPTYPREPEGHKPGCPLMNPETVGICISQCSYDTDCPEDSLCCSNGCGTTCVPKVYPDKPPEYEESPKPYPEPKKKKKKKPKVVKKTKCSVKYSKSPSVLCDEGTVCVAALPRYSECNGMSIDECPLVARCASEQDAPLCSTTKCSSGSFCILQEVYPCKDGALCQVRPKCISPPKKKKKPKYPPTTTEAYPTTAAPYPEEPTSYPEEPAPYPEEPAPYPEQPEPYPAQPAPYPETSDPESPTTYPTYPELYKPEKVDRLKKFYRKCKPYNVRDSGLCLEGEKCVAVVAWHDPCLYNRKIKCSIYKAGCKVDGYVGCENVRCKTSCVEVESTDCIDMCTIGKNYQTFKLSCPPTAMCLPPAEKDCPPTKPYPSPTAYPSKPYNAKTKSYPKDIIY